MSKIIVIGKLVKRRVEILIVKGSNQSNGNDL